MNDGVRNGSPKTDPLHLNILRPYQAVMSRQPVAIETEGPGFVMEVTRIFTGEDGRSHFEELEIPSTDLGPPLGEISESVTSDSAFFRSIGVEGEEDVYDYHCAPRRQFVIHLKGSVEIETGDGTKRRFGVGDVLLADDTTGEGHISRGVDTPREQVFIVVPDDLDLTKWRK